MALLLLPAALLAAPPAPTPAEVLVEALEGVSECVVEGRTRRLEGRIRHAREAWAARRDTLAKRIPPDDLAALDLCFLHMDAGGRAAARAASWSPGPRSAWRPVTSWRDFLRIEMTSKAVHPASPASTNSIGRAPWPRPPCSGAVSSSRE